MNEITWHPPTWRAVADGRRWRILDVTGATVALDFSSRQSAEQWISKRVATWAARNPVSLH